MASLETIGPLMTGMKCRPDMSGLACEALNRMFQKEQTELVAQVTFQRVSNLFVPVKCMIVPDIYLFL